MASTIEQIIHKTQEQSKIMLMAILHYQININEFYKME